MTFPRFCAPLERRISGDELVAKGLPVARCVKMKHDARLRYDVADTYDDMRYRFFSARRFLAGDMLT